MSVRRHWKLVGASALALALVACSGSEGSGSGDDGGDDGGENGTAAGDPVNLTMTTYTADENIHATYQRLADEFREENPEFGELNIETIPQADYITQLTVRLSGGDAPDIGWMTGANLPAFVDAGLLHDMAELKNDPVYQYDDLVENLVGSAAEGDSLWAHPFANTIHPVVYNVDVFEEAGIDTPRELYEAGDWTWEELRRISGELVDSGLVTYGFDIPGFAFTNLNLFQLVQNAYGAESWPASGQCGYTDEGSVAAFQLFHDMIFSDGSYPGKGDTSSFPTGDTGMYLHAPSWLSTLDDVEFEFDVVPQPTPVGDRGPLLSQAWMVTFAGGANPDLATRLLGHMMSESGASELMEYYVPPRTSLLTGENLAQLSSSLAPEDAQVALVDPMADAVQPNFPTNYPELESAVLPVIDGIWNSGADVPAVLQAACDAAEPLLGQG